MPVIQVEAELLATGFWFVSITGRCRPYHSRAVTLDELIAAIREAAGAPRPAPQPLAPPLPLPPGPAPRPHHGQRTDVPAAPAPHAAPAAPVEVQAPRRPIGKREAAQMRAEADERMMASLTPEQQAQLMLRKAQLAAKRGRAA